MSKKKKILLSIIIIFASLWTIYLVYSFITWCNKKYYWEVAQSVENISTIEIVEVDSQQNVHIISEIVSSDYEQVVKDIQALQAYLLSNSKESPYGKAFKITFLDGKYDLVSEYEPRHIIEPERNILFAPFSGLYYKSADLNKLIEKWSNYQ